MNTILCLAPHPDDAEIYCGGLLLLTKRAGMRVVIVDCTRGEMGTRGSVELRKREAAAADRMLSTDARLNLKLRDGHLRDDDALREPLVGALRRFRPRIVLAPYWEDQHPDHAAVGRAAEHAAYLCGVPKYAPRSARGVAHPERIPYRPELLLHYNNRYGISAGLVLDISGVFEEKIKLVGCYASQFGAGSAGGARHKKEPLTRLSSEAFLTWFRARHAFYGSQIGAAFGEAFCTKGPIPLRGVEWLFVR